MSTMTPARPKIKPTRRTARPAVPFGTGVFPRPARFEPSAEDRAAAAAMFADDEPDYDTLAGEAAFLASCEAMTPPPAGYCRSCGELAEALSHGLCDACDDAGTEATIKGENGRAGLGYRVF